MQLGRTRSEGGAPGSGVRRGRCRSGVWEEVRLRLAIGHIEASIQGVAAREILCAGRDVTMRPVREAAGTGCTRSGGAFTCVRSAWHQRPVLILIVACTCPVPLPWCRIATSCGLFTSLPFARHPSISSHMTMADATIDAPEVPILLLGDAEVGKSTFLS